MAKKRYVVIDGKIKKVRKRYVVMDNKVKKVRKGYVVVGGKIRPFWTGGELAYYGNSEDGAVEALNDALYFAGATTVGGFAIIAGGVNNTSVAYAYDRNLTRTLLPGLSYRYNLAATTVGEYAVFAGGTTSSSFPTSVVEAYNKNLTKITAPELSKARSELQATTVGGFALFGGGSVYLGGGDFDQSSYVDSYNENLTKISCTNLNSAKANLGATTVGNFALFAGGYSNSSRVSDTVEVYNIELSKSTITPLSTPMAGHAATTVGNFAIFAGGYNYTESYLALANAYDKDLVQIIPTQLSKGRQNLCATTVDNYGLFAGGAISAPPNPGNYTLLVSATVDAYNDNLTKSIPKELSKARKWVTAATIGDFALFSGGYVQYVYYPNGDGAETRIDVYAVA